MIYSEDECIISFSIPMLGVDNSVRYFQSIKLVGAYCVKGVKSYKLFIFDQ